MKKMVFGLVLACLVTAALVLSSCSSTPADTEEAPAAAVTPAAAVAPAVVEPNYGGTITVQVTNPPVGWDNSRAHWSVALWGSPAYEKAFWGDIEKYGPRGDNSWPFNVVSLQPESVMEPQLVESWEMPNEQTIIWHVRKGVKFHNKAPVFGRELDAHDIVAELNIIKEVPRFKVGYWSFVDNFEALDDYTVQVNVHYFFSLWKFFIGSGYYTEIPPVELAEQGVSDDWKFVAGTGPWILDDYVTDVGSTFVSNPDYWDTTTIEGKDYKLPFADSLKMVLIRDEATALAAMRTGKLDMDWVLPLDRKDELIKQIPELVWSQGPWPPGDNNVYMRVDEGPPLDDIRVRRALWMAVDYEDISDKISGGVGLYPYTAVVNLGFPQETPKAELPAELVETFTFNLEKAKALLTEAGYPTGFKTQLWIGSDERSIDVASLLAGYWDKLGVELEIVTNEAAVHFSLTQELGHHGMAMRSLGGEPPLGSANFYRPDHPQNVAQWRDQKFEELFLAASKETDFAKQTVIVKELDIYHAMSYTVKKLTARMVYSVWWPWVKNYYGEFDSAYQNIGPIVARAWIDEDLKKEMGY